MAEIILLLDPYCYYFEAMLAEGRGDGKSFMPTATSHAHNAADSMEVI